MSTQELAGAGVVVAGRLDQPHGRLADVVADLWRQVRRGRFLDQLLMAALQRAIALPQMDDVAVPVAEDLHFDVARLLDVLFEVDAAVLEGLLGFLLGGVEAGLQADVVAGHAHAAAAAAGRRLDQHRDSRSRRASCSGLGLVGRSARRCRARRARSASLGQLAGLVLVAQPAHRLVRRADELDVAVAAHLGEVGVFRQEAVAGMDRLHVGDLGGADDARRS